MKGFTNGLSECDDVIDTHWMCVSDMKRRREEMEGYEKENESEGRRMAHDEKEEEKGAKRKEKKEKEKEKILRKIYQELAGPRGCQNLGPCRIFWQVLV